MTLALVFLFISMISVQFGASIAKTLFPVVGALGTTSLRVFFAALILVILFKPWRVKIPRKDLMIIASYGAVLGLMNLLFYQALARIPLGIAVALEFTGPLSVALLSSRRKLDLLWACLAALGIFFILPRNSLSQPLDMSGIILALCAGICWAFYIILGQRAGTKAHSGSVTAIGMIFATIVTLPFGVMSVNFAVLTPQNLFLGILVAIFSGAIPYSLEMISLARLPAKTFGILMSLEPAIAALMGLFFLSEKLSLMQWLAVFCVIMASLGSTLLTKSDPILGQSPEA